MKDELRKAVKYYHLALKGSEHHWSPTADLLKQEQFQESWSFSNLATPLTEPERGSSWNLRHCAMPWSPGAVP